MKPFLKLAVVLVVLVMGIGVLAAQTTSPKMPTFFARRDYPGLTSLWIQIADTNGDGFPDLIEGQGGVQVWFGNANGTFQPGPKSNPIPAEPPPYAPSYLAVDLNGDGKTDLALVSGGIIASLGNGDGTFQTGVAYPINDSESALVAGDFNGDGIPDIATPGASGIWLLIGKGDGTFNIPVLAASLANGGTNIAAADFNEDGKLDLVVTQLATPSGGGFAVLFGNGDGTFQAPQLVSTGTRPIAVAAGSLTKGGPPGIIVNATYLNYVYLYFGNGKGSFSGPRFVNLPGTFSSGLAIGDVNGDGLPDLVSELGYVAYGEGGGYFTKAVNYPIEAGDQISNVVLADLRNSGLPDVITGGYDAISVLLNEGKGLLEDGIWTNVSGGAGCGVKGDFNGDGRPDLAVNTPSGISILLGTGKAAAPFAAGTSIALVGAECPVTGYVNGDAKLDLLVPANGTVITYLSNGDGTFTEAGTTVTPTGGYLAIGDFNRDGKLDFATSGNLLALGNGDGTFQAPVDIVASPPEGGFSGITSGDINNDGWADLVLTSNNFPVDTNATVLLNNRQGGFTQVPITFGTLTYNPILADVNGDGKLDLVLSQAGLLSIQPVSYGATIYLGNGSGEFTFSQTVGAQTQNSTFNLVADVNGDGIPDIFELQFSTLEIYLGEGGGTFAAPFSVGTGPSPGSILVENLHGQSLKASLPDIVVPDTSGGVMTLINLTR